MSAVERIVAFAADQLPDEQRARYLEEWNAQLAGSAEVGVSRLGVALGALTFAIRSPYPSVRAADWWGRWTLAVAVTGPVLWYAVNQAGLFYSYEAVRATFELLVALSVLVVILLGVVTLRRARRVTGALLASVIAVCLTGALWVVGVPKPALFLGAVALAMFGLIVLSALLAKGRFGGDRRLALVTLGTVVVPAVIAATWMATNVVPPDAVEIYARWTPGALAILTLVPTLFVVHRSPRAPESTGWPRPVAAALVAAGGATAVIAGFDTWKVLTVPSGPIETKFWARVAPETLATIGGVLALAAVILALALTVLSVARTRPASIRRWATSAAMVGAAAIGMLAGGIAGSGPAVGRPLGILEEIAVHTIGAFACALLVVAVVRLVAPGTRAVGSV